ncbi:hypothetical protein LA76x_2018 [Lysobacter antibioticus]|uniref:Uncharacterized protein n=1 Tax=Lysobacter antibioticus TaxID=84531 RepID=A0A0S2F9D4_LYSAN|nr:hypothetical protein LA76x_2018 [Lysobacter antibioticus]
MPKSLLQERREPRLRPLKLAPIPAIAPWVGAARAVNTLRRTGHARSNERQRQYAFAALPDSMSVLRRASQADCGMQTLEDSYFAMPSSPVGAGLVRCPAAAA